MEMNTVVTMKRRFVAKRSRYCIGVAATAFLASIPHTKAFTAPTVLHHRHEQLTPLYAAGFGRDDITAMKSSRDSSSRVGASSIAEDYRDEQQTLQERFENPWLREYLLPVVSASLLITGNTIGAGCLVLPGLAAGPGLAASTGVFCLSWMINVVSALILSEIAIKQKELHNSEVPSSFKEFAQVNLGSDQAGTIVSSISLFVNACVLAFDLSRVGIVGASLTGLPAQGVSSVVAISLVGLLTTLSTPNLSAVCGLCVTALFASFGGLLIPGLLSVSNPIETILQPGLAPDLFTSLEHTAPIILMSMIFQNIVPTVTKLLNYDRSKTVTALVLGSMMPLVMYLAWCFACLGGGIDTGALGLSAGMSGALMAIFSISSLGGSSMCSSMSLAEELSGDQVKEERATFALPAALAAVALPLSAALYWSNDSAGLTGALSLAGSFGSPVLYGVIPVMMAWRQRQQEETGENLVPTAALPALGLVSTAFVGQEFVSRMAETLTVAM